MEPITNILAAVTVFFVTNTTETAGTKMVPAPCPDAEYGKEDGAIRFTCAALHWQTVDDPSTRIKTTTVEKVTQAKMNIDGQEVVLEKRETVSTESKYFSKKVTEEWVPSRKPRDEYILEFDTSNHFTFSP